MRLHGSTDRVGSCLGMNAFSLSIGWRLAKPVTCFVLLGNAVGSTATA